MNTKHKAGQNMTQKKKNTKKSGGMALSFLLSMLFGAAVALAVMRVLDTLGDGWLPFAAVLALMAASAWLQILLHEAGHLVCGLLSGYRFLSFRIGSFVLQRDPDGFRLKRFTLAGTGGQCLMVPPKMHDGTIPFVLYNLGGVLMNLAAAALCGVLALFFNGYVSAFLWMMMVLGAEFAVLNGIPLRLQLPNDGRNVCSMRRNPQAVYAFWLQLEVNARLAHGERLREMPAEWFVLPQDTDAENDLVAGIAVLAENRLMDMQDVQRAREAAQHLADSAALPDVQRALLRADMVFLDVLEQGSAADILPLAEKTTRAVLRKMRDYPAVLRTRYAVALLHDHDVGSADAIRQRLCKIAHRYPSSAEIESEREWMHAVVQRAELLSSNH